MPHTEGTEDTEEKRGEKGWMRRAADLLDVVAIPSPARAHTGSVRTHVCARRGLPP
jgi:hypothetical protein